MGMKARKIIPKHYITPSKKTRFLQRKRSLFLCSSDPNIIDFGDLLKFKSLIDEGEVEMIRRQYLLC